MTKKKDLAKDLKKLKKSLKEVRERNEKLAGEVEELRESHEESRGAFEAAVKDLEAKSESSAAVAVGADGGVISRSEDPEGAPEGYADAPKVSADDEISPDSPEPQAQPKPKATESAARKAEELGVSLVGVEGTGSRGRITVEDVEKAAGRS